MSSIGIFYTMSGDIIQPKYRGDLLKTLDSCWIYHEQNVKSLLMHGHLVDVYIVINYKTKLIPDIKNKIQEKFKNIGINFNLKVVKYKALKKELFGIIDYHNDDEIKNEFNKFFNHSDSLWIQPYQFISRAYNYLNYDFYIKSRLDSYVLKTDSFTEIINRFSYAKNRYVSKNSTKGYCITTEIFLNSLEFGIDVADVLYALDKSAVFECYNNIKDWFKLSSYGQDIFYCEEILATILNKNQIATFTCPTAMPTFVYKNDIIDPINFR